MSSSKTASAAIPGALFAALVTLPGLWSGTLWDDSETAYGEVAREVLLTGNWIVMHQNLLPWFVQPPLYFWIAALFAHWFGAGSFAMRLPSALATIAAGALLAGSVARLAGARAGIIASFVLSSCLIQAVLGRLATMDAMLDTFVLWAILAAARAFGLRERDDGHAHAAALFAAAVAVALGVLTKGPVALAVPALVAGIWFLWERRIRTPRALPSPLAWAGAAVLALAIVVPWFALLATRAGTGGVAELIVHYTFGRYVGTIENQTGPVWYYLPVVVLGLFPWTAFLVPALFVKGLDGRDARAALARLAVVWAIVPLAFFSFAQTKLPNYIALAFPAYAILIALWFDRLAQFGADRSPAARAARRSAIVAAAFVPLTAGLVGVALAIFSRTMKLAGADFLRTDLTVLGAILLAGSLATLAAVLVRGWTVRAPFVLATTMLAWFLTLAFAGLPHAEALKPVPRLAALVNAQRRPGDAVAIMGVPGGNALVFYTAPPVDTLALPGTIPTNGAKDARAVICGAPRALVVTARVPPAQTWGRRRTILATDGKDALTLYDGPPCASAR